MPSPFSKKKEQGHTGPDMVESTPVVNSSLICDRCFYESSEGSYYPSVKRLVWSCDSCGEVNIVRDIQL